MRFEVPQFIEIEDRIFGPFTWKQFVYLTGGVGIAVVLFFTANIILFILIGIPAAGLAFLLAFYPVNNRPFSVFLESVVNFYRNRRIYYWRKRHASVYKSDTMTPTSTTTTPVAIPAKGPGGINSLSRQLEMQALQKQE